MKTMWAVKSNGKPYKELVKIAHPLIMLLSPCVRSGIILLKAGRQHHEVLS
jgi:hypothetical protein